MSDRYDVIIAGAGPAGISAALYTVRAGLSTLVIANGGGSLEKAKAIDNYYGFAESVSGAELLENGIAQARRMGCDILTSEEITAVSWNGDYTVTTATGSYTGRTLILATGAKRDTVASLGLERFEGAGVSWCAVCDGFFHRGKAVAVLGAGDYAAHEAQVLLGVAAEVYVLTNGAQPAAMPEGARVIEAPVKELVGDGMLSGVRLADGTELSLSGLFVAVGTAGGTELARKLGAPIKDGRIVVDANMATMLPGVFAAGDCVSRVGQVSIAVGQGAEAGLSAVAFLKK